MIVGAVGNDNRLGPSVEPDWDAAREIAAGMSSSRRLVAGAAGSPPCTRCAAPSAHRPRRRIVAAVALVAVAAAVALAFVVPSLEAEPKADEAAAAAVRALPTSP